MIWIVYRTTCKINGKFYIGVHKTETDEIFDGYYGNGIQIPKHTYSITHPKYPFHFAFKKYGQDQFYRETLAKFDNPIDAYKYEAKLVTPEVINKGNTYNVTAGGGRTHPTKGKVYQYSLANYLKFGTVLILPVKFYKFLDNLLENLLIKKWLGMDFYEVEIKT